VNQLEKEAGADAICSSERSPRTQHASNLSQHAVLLLADGDVVQHREAHDRRESAIVERQLYGIGLYDGDRVSEHVAQFPAIALLELDHGQLSRTPLADQ
jgi:hypothetical protein